MKLNMTLQIGSKIVMKDGTKTILERGKAGEFFLKTNKGIVYGGVSYYTKDSLIEFLESIFNCTVSIQ